MQATSIQLAAMLTVLEMALRDLLAAHGAAGPALPPSSAVPAEMRAGLRRVHASLMDQRFRQDLAGAVEAEEDIYRRGARTSYFADALGVDVLTDTTERSPTFCTPSFRKRGDAEAAESWAFLFTPVADTELAWPRLLRREPQTIEWTDDDLRALLDEDAAAKQAAVLSDIHRAELLRFRIGLDGLADRPFRSGDGATAVVAGADLGLLGDGGAFAGTLAAARDVGARTVLLAVGPPDVLRRIGASPAARAAGLTVSLAVPDTAFLLDPLTRFGAKLLLNALSTCVMVRLGRVLGNRMIWLVPSNLKLIDRSTRYIRDLSGVPYDAACRTLFEVIEYVEPRRRAGKVYPSPVGVATMRLRHGLSLEDAERRLYEELG
jgi:N-acetylmuramic acid 6-phosphate etherase